MPEETQTRREARSRPRRPRKKEAISCINLKLNGDFADFNAGKFGTVRSVAELDALSAFLSAVQTTAPAQYDGVCTAVREWASRPHKSLRVSMYSEGDELTCSFNVITDVPSIPVPALKQALHKAGWRIHDSNPLTICLANDPTSCATGEAARLIISSLL